MSKKDSTRRFSNRVLDYTKYRPRYPAEAIDFIRSTIRPDPGSLVADIGAGTGLFTEALLSSGLSVVAVEPNTEMRVACDQMLGDSPNYSSLPGTAENTGLDNHSVVLITAAQAFHWFDLERTKQEFQRILKPGGKIILIWNRRVSNSSEFLADYESMLVSTLPEYSKVTHANNASDEIITSFLGDHMTVSEFPNHQNFNLEGLKGRLLSSSYCPAAGEDGHADVMTKLEQLFEQHELSNGTVRFDYVTQVYMG